MWNLHHLLAIVALGCVCMLYVDVEPYMDEIFHIPQAQQYCQGNFHHWDSKITTFPGLYLYAAALHSAMLMGQSVCSVMFLRVANLFLAAASLFIYRACRQQIVPSKSVQDADLISLLLLVYPISLFYYFLFYTDTASTTTICIVYYLSLSRRATAATSHQRNRQKVVAQSPSKMQHSTTDSTSWTCQLLLLVASCIAILMRQTNAVWLLFIAGTAMVDRLQHEKRLRIDPQDVAFIQLLELVIQLIRNLPQLLFTTWPLLGPVGVFVVFVLVNGGVVVGDKEHHHPVHHWAMPLHFVAQYTLVLAPLFVYDMWTVFYRTMKRIGEIITTGGKSPTSREKRTPTGALQSGQKEWGNWPPTRLWMWAGVHLTGLAAIAYVLYFHCLSHPFLLADNRHYTFYLWSRILSKPALRLALAPLYYVALLWSLTRWWRARGTLWVWIFLVAVVLTLVPAHLLEPRYFTPAVVVALLNSPTEPDEAGTSQSSSSVSSKNKDTKCVPSTAGGVSSSLVLSIVLCCVVDVITVYVFLYRPFTWGDGSLARFMY